MKKIKEKIFGISGLFIVVLVNFFAFDKYLEQSKNNQDTVQKEIPTNTAFSTITMQVSASSSSTTTTPPQGM